MPDLSLAYKAKFDALRTVYFGLDAEAQLIRYQADGDYDVQGGVLLENWNASRTELRAGNNVQFFDYCDVDNEHQADLEKATGVIIRLSSTDSGVFFKFTDKDMPFGLTRVWTMIIQRTGEQE